MLVDNILTLGVNHKTAPVEVREQLAFSGDCETPLVQIEKIEGCEECCLLSTCNRVEIIFTSKNPGYCGPAMRRFLFNKSNVSEKDAEKYSYLYQGREAVEHVFSVAASLDSMIVGEPQILGQLKQAYRQAVERGSTGVILNRLMDKSFSVAKRIRTETNIGGSAVSISYAAVQLAKKIFGQLNGKKVLLIGAGEMAELAAEHLITQGISEVVVANRTLERAAKLARRFNGTAVGLDEIVSQLEMVDIIISSTGATDLVLKRQDVKPVMKERMNSPLFLIDIAVPRDLDPALNKLDNVYLYDIDDLKNVVDINKTERDKEAAKGNRIVGEETMKFLQWLENMEIAPTIAAVKQKADEICRAEVERTQANFRDLSKKQRKSLEKLAFAVAGKILHNPIIYLKNECPPEKKQFKVNMFRDLFGLDANNTEQDSD